MHNSLRADDDDYSSNNLVRAATKVFSMGTNIVNKEKVVSGTCSEDSVTLCLSSLRVPQDIVSLLLICIYSCKKICGCDAICGNS